VRERLVLAGVVAAAVVLATARPVLGQLDQLRRALGLATPPAGLTDARVAAALREALQVSTRNAVQLTGRLDGYFANEAIRIPMPDRLRSLERGLRALGYGAQVDEFVLGMNRAAERAAPQARQIFAEAIGALTIDDARRILSAGDTAATEYFKAKTTDRLTAAFRPAVEQAMGEVGITRQYRELLARARSLPFFQAEDYDLDRYVVGKSLDGLFHVMAAEERKIRTDPAARVSDLLRDVFAAR
jgi:hypothetical protein